MKGWVTRGVSILLLVSMMVSCVPGGFSGPGRPSERVLMTESARMIDASYDSVRQILVENGEYSEEEFASYGTVDGESVTRALRGMDGGDAYLAFLYASDKFKNIDEVLDSASSILDDATMDELRKRAEEIESKAILDAEPILRSLNATQREEFYNDLRTLVVKSVVLLTSAIVYAFIPKMLFWGKVSAATAVSVSAGVVASTLVTIVEWADKDTVQTDSSFSDWLTSVTVDPFTNWALAQGVINAQGAISESPITAALILGVFAIYNVIESAKTMLEKYNFKV